MGAPSGTGSRPAGRASKAVSPVPASIPSAVWLAFNMNHNVRVRLTERGMEVLRAEHQRYADFMPEVFGGEFVPPKLDDEGFAKYQLWQLFQTFGSAITMGSPVPFETVILLEASWILTEGGDAKQAPGDSLSSPTLEDGDAPEQSHD